jgi:hypothetical protein
MTFRYVPLDTGYGIYYMPLLFAEIFHPADLTRRKELLCLADSGAGATLINDEYAEAFGIEGKLARLRPPHPEEEYEGTEQG